MCKFDQIPLLVSLALFSLMGYTQEVIPLYEGKTPTGSELLTLPEKVRTDSITGEIITIRNVSMPTITVYKPEEGKANGTALIIAPGGGFQGLAWQTEGTPTAKWCVDNGITAFILKYRLMPYPYPELEKADRVKRDSIFTKFVRLATNDGLEAIRLVRSHASEYGVDPSKIGVIGYSAGGTVVGSVAQTYDKESRPDFVVPIYAYCGAIIGENVPEDAPPMFIAWATDDGIARGNPGFYEKWRDAQKSVEMHAFYSGGHGFSVTKHEKASDKWTELFMDWMVNLNILKK